MQRTLQLIFLCVEAQKKGVLRGCAGHPVVGRRATFPRSPAVSSPRRGLTSLFGMGRGAPPRLCRHSCASRPVHGPCVSRGDAATDAGRREGRSPTGGAAHRAAASVRAISAARLNTSPCSHLRPIDVVVSDGPQRRPHLGGGFALRCTQRLSRPDAATRPCAWRRNRHTVGPSDPVLSY